MEVEYYLGILDYLIIVLTLLISTAIGIKFKSSSHENGKMREYFMAGKNMYLLPVIMSGAATMISPQSTLGMPAEAYKYGIQFGTMSLGMSIGMVLAAYVFIPVYFQCGVCTVFEYLEMRFGRPTRYFISVMFIIQMVLWMSVVLYSPVIAMNVVTHLPIEPTIVVFGAICSIYCAFGGLKAVLWTDVFQISLMFVTLVMLFAAGIEDAGGLANVIDRAKEGGRLNFFKFQFDFVTKYTFWNGLFQGVLTGAAIYGVNQTGVQRFLSLRNAERAKSAVLISNPILTILLLSACLHGIILYAVYFKCDPILNSKETGLTNYDQIVLFGLLPGFILTQWIGFTTLFSDYNEPPLPLSTSMCTSSFNSTHDYSTSGMSNIVSPSTTTVPSPHGETFAVSKIPYFWVRTIGFVVTFCCTYLIISIKDRNSSAIPADSKYLSPVVKLWMKKTENADYQQENTNNFALESQTFAKGTN